MPKNRRPSPRAGRTPPLEGRRKWLKRESVLLVPRIVTKDLNVNKYIAAVFAGLGRRSRARKPADDFAPSRSHRVLSLTPVKVQESRSQKIELSSDANVRKGDTSGCHWLRRQRRTLDPVGLDLSYPLGTESARSAAKTTKAACGDCVRFAHLTQ